MPKKRNPTALDWFRLRVAIAALRSRNACPADYSRVELHRALTWAYDNQELPLFMSAINDPDRHLSRISDEIKPKQFVQMLYALVAEYRLATSNTKE